MSRLLILQFAICYSLFSCVYGQGGIPQNDQESTMFTRWNSETIASLKNQLRVAKGDTQYVRRIAIRIDAFKSYLGIEDESELNRESIRFKFLNTLRQESLLPRDFCLAEIRSAGERVIIKNLLFEKLGADSLKIIEFDYMEEDWKKIEERKVRRWEFKSPLVLERVPFGKGGNPDDVIITRFRKFKILESEYFIYGTFSKYEMIRNAAE